MRILTYYFAVISLIHAYIYNYIYMRTYIRNMYFKKDRFFLLLLLLYTRLYMRAHMSKKQ